MNKNRKKYPHNYKTTTTRTRKNRAKYYQAKKSHQYSSALKKILYFSFFINIILLGYVFIHKPEPKIITKTRKVVTVSPNYVFLGDSITEFYDLKKYFPKEPIVNSGISGDTTEDILNNMEKRVYQYNPSKVFLLIGTNDLQEGKTVEEVVTNIKKIISQIQKMRPQTEIYLESICPVNESDEKGIKPSVVDKRNNHDIKKINEQLKSYAKKENLLYIDLYKVLKNNQDDNLKIEYTKEGLHISEKGYEMITKELKQYME